MSKKMYYANNAANIIKNGGNAKDVHNYLEKVCAIERPISKAAFKAAIVLAMN